MQMRMVSAAGALLVVLLVGVSLAGASSSYKRYTVPAASLRVIPNSATVQPFAPEWSPIA